MSSGKGPDDCDQTDGGYDRTDGGYDQTDSGYDQTDSGYDRTDSGYDRTDSGYDRTDGEVDHVRGEASDRQPVLQGTVVRYDDRPDEYTLHPKDSTEQERTTAWITAEKGAYVSVTVWR